MQYSQLLDDGKISAKHFLSLMANIKNEILYEDNEISLEEDEIEVSLETELMEGADLPNTLEGADLPDTHEESFVLYYSEDEGNITFRGEEEENQGESGIVNQF